MAEIWWNSVLGWFESVFGGENSITPGALLLYLTITAVATGVFVVAVVYGWNYRSRHRYIHLRLDPDEFPGPETGAEFRRFKRPEKNEVTLVYDVHLERTAAKKGEKGEFYPCYTAIPPEKFDDPPFCFHTWPTAQRCFHTGFYDLYIVKVPHPVECWYRIKPPRTACDWLALGAVVALFPIGGVVHFTFSSILAIVMVVFGASILTWWLVDYKRNPPKVWGNIPWCIIAPSHPTMEVQALKVGFRHKRQLQDESGDVQPAFEVEGPQIIVYATIEEFLFLRELDNKTIKITLVEAFDKQDPPMPFTKIADYGTILNAFHGPNRLKPLIHRLVLAESNVRLLEAELEKQLREMGRVEINSARKFKSIRVYIAQTLKALEIHIEEIYVEIFGVPSDVVFKQRFRKMFNPDAEDEGGVVSVRNLREIMREVRAEEREEEGRGNRSFFDWLRRRK
jgi:hypothetical protein